LSKYTAKNAFTEVHLVHGKYITSKSRDSIVTSELASRDFTAKSTKKEQEDVRSTQAKIDKIAQAWGITPKKS